MVDYLKDILDFVKVYQGQIGNSVVLSAFAMGSYYLEGFLKQTWKEKEKESADLFSEQVFINQRRTFFPSFVGGSVKEKKK